MRKFVMFLAVVALVGGAVYAHVTYPAGCERLRVDSSRDAAEVLHAVLPPLKKLASDTMSDLVHMKAPLPAENPASPRTVVGPESTDVAPADTTSVPAKTEVTAPSPPMWKAPSPLPAKPGWTWRTVSGDVYNDVKIVGMGQDSVIILYTGGGRRVAVADLPPELQMELGYAPSAGAKVAPSQNAEGQQAATPQPAKMMPGWVTEDYQEGVAQARWRGKKVLLLFTGSTWCPSCMQLEKEILPTPEFQNFGESGYVMVKIELPHDGTVTDPKIQQNEVMAQKYNVHGVPTLIATTLDGQELARMEGCPQDSATLIARLSGPTPNQP